MSTPTPQLSRYEVLGRIASGGMAEVWLARALGAAGFEKLVVIKTILPQLAKDPNFVTMFVNEGRLAARLNHPNCVQIFDLGLEDGVLYLAMEYIEGFALSRVLSRAKTKGVAMGEKIISRIAMDAASGLDYAHRLADRDGTPLRLVHRDVSPDNLLISLSGQTRIVDFGIAKAATPTLLASATAAGTVKGKHGFIAPEYLLGLDLDGRADIFALGVVLYRALTRRRPFGGANESEVSLAVIKDTPVAPHKLDELISPALSDVVMTALAKDPGARYQTARDLRHAIEAAVGRPADVEEVGDFMTRLWPPGDEERTALSTLAAGTEEHSGPALSSVGSGAFAGQNATPAGNALVVHATPPTAEELAKQLMMPRKVSARHAAVDGANAAPGHPAVTEAPMNPRKVSAKLGAVPPPAPAPPAVAVFDTPQFDPPSRGPSALISVLAVVALCVTGGLGWMYLQQREQLQKTTPAPAPLPPVVAANPVPDEPVDASVAAPAVAAAVEVPPPAAAAAEGTVQLAPPISVHVFDGKEDLGATPLTLTRPAGELSLRLVNKAQNVDQVVRVKVEAGGTVKVDALARGALVIKVDPWAYVKVDGKSYGQTPVTLKGLTEGPHLVELHNVGLNEKRRREVKVKGGETKTVSVNLLEDSVEE